MSVSFSVLRGFSFRDELTFQKEDYLFGILVVDFLNFLFFAYKNHIERRNSKQI